MDERFDVVIAGGGPVGTSLALSLRESGLAVALLEPRAAGAASDDGRSIALAHGTRLILERLGVWSALAPWITPIMHVEVSQQGGFGRVEMNADAAGVPALGYVSGYAQLQRALVAALERSPTRILKGQGLTDVQGDAGWRTATTTDGTKLAARLVVIADGGAGLRLAHVKTRDYHQSAVVCDIASSQAHRNRAFERFTPRGPLALLPNLRGWSLVWTAASADAGELASMGNAEFCNRLRKVLGGCAGEFSDAGERRVFPLALKYAIQSAAPRTVLIGNAAQTLHPVAGQGLNLGMRDMWELARCITTRVGDDPGSDKLLKAFFSQRRFDRIATILFTDSLIQLFCKDIPPLNWMRGAGLAAMSVSPHAKTFLMRRMMYGARG